MEDSRFFFQTHGDPQGTLVAIEGSHEIPFPIRRVYYIYGISQDAVRGCHAHKQLQQVLICVHGSCKVMLDNGKERKVLVLDQPNEGVYIPNATWREVYDCSSDTILLVLASDFYHESDYIRTYDDFLDYVRNLRE